MNKKVTIECGFEEACLIERALDLYSRVGLLQFEYLTGCYSLQKLIWRDRLTEDFRDVADDMKALFGYAPNSHPGIFNKEDVDDDARIAAHLYQQFRHERFKDRVVTGQQKESKYTVDEYPADICQIGEMKIPDCKIQINNYELPEEGSSKS
jgi:hypothetical protein